MSLTIVFTNKTTKKEAFFTGIFAFATCMICYFVRRKIKQKQKEKEIKK